MTDALVSNIQKFSIHDGPGIRTTVFLKGCPLLCAWCHNPESQIFTPELLWDKNKCIGCGACVKACPNSALRLSEQGVTRDQSVCSLCGACAAACPTLAMELLGRRMSVEQVLAQVEQDRDFYEQSQGGVTLSGGEPLSQADFCAEFLAACRRRNIHTCVDTSGYVPLSAVQQAAPYTDLFLYDVKALDDGLHRQYMQAGNEPILRNLRWLAENGAHIWVRVPTIPGVNDSPQQITELGEFCRQLGLNEVFLLPYHKMAAAKYKRLGLPYQLDGVEDPSDEHMQQLADILRAQGLRAHIGGGDKND